MDNNDKREMTPEQPAQGETVTQETVRLDAVQVAEAAAPVTQETVRLDLPEVVEVAEEVSPMQVLSVERTEQETLRLDLEEAHRLTEHPDLDDTQVFDLDEIMKEFSQQQAVKAQVSQPEEKPEEEKATSDTVRLDTAVIGRAAKKVRGAVRIEKEENQEPFSEQWEPEYEQPMGEYVPPQPIQFRPRSKIRELKRKLVAGPEKRYYELAEAGLGKLQIVMVLSVLVALLAAGSTVMYAMGMVQENRIKLMVFGQFFAMLVSALLGCQQLLEGFFDVFKKRYTLNTMLVITFLLCALDGVLGLRQLRVPCCAAFSLAVTMSLWNAYQRRNTEMGQMDTLRKAVRLDGVHISSDYFEGRKGLLRKDGELDDFMDSYAVPSAPEKVLCWYAFIATVLSLGLGVGAYVLHGGLSTAIQVAAVSLLAAMPVSAFVTISRPMGVLQRKLHAVGTVLCGWQGVKALRGRAVFPVEYADLFPVGSARMNGVKFFGSRPTDEVVAYCTALITANGSGLAPLFEQVLASRNGYHYDCQDLRCYENGGLGGVVEGEQVLVGSMSFLKEMGVEIPGGMRVNQAVCVAVEGELCGLFALTYENARTAAVGLASLCTGRGANPIMVTEDFLLNKGFLCSRFGINPRKLRFPEYDLRRQLQQKQPDEGKPAAMLVTREGLASYASGVIGAKALRSACGFGVAVHMIGGIVGLAIMALLTYLGRWDLLTPANMFLYQLVWMIPGLLITEWTRTI